MKSEQLKQNEEISNLIEQIHSIGICNAVQELSSIGIPESLHTFSTGNLVTESFTSNMSKLVEELLPAFKISIVIPESFPTLEKSWNEISCEKNVSRIPIKPLLRGFEYKYLEYNYEDDILRELILSCSILQGIVKCILWDEDSRNTVLATILERRGNLDRRGIIIKDQTRWGRSATGKSCGELDLKIQDTRGTPIAVCEAFILKSLEKNNIDIHLSKIFGYDPHGLRQNFVIIYSEASNFTELWKKYLLYLSEINFQHPILSIKDISSKVSTFAEIKIALTTHQRQDNITKIYHIFINMNI
jgi:hypothetical protein